MEKPKYKWARPGDINAFFGLMLDNISNLVILSGILVGVIGYPKEIVLYRMIPGTAVGVLVGDLVYTWMAFRLARRTGRDEVCAMPLGLDTPSAIALSFLVLGPAYHITGDPYLGWKVGMAVLVLMGVFKVFGAWFGPVLRRVVPRAGLLGSIAGVALVLIAFLPSTKVFAHPLVGICSLGIIILTLIGKHRLPFNFPGAFAAVIAGSILFYFLVLLGYIDPPWKGSFEEFVLSGEMRFSLPVPTLGFLEGLPYAWKYLPVAIPFALATIVGGIDVTESAAAAGDEYSTRDILLTEGVATVLAGLCGGVIQNTPYIGHPAYKNMGGRAGYTLATALFIGIGGIVGYISFFVNLLPEAAVYPILIFIGLEITAQAFIATPSRHARAVAIAFIPTVAYLIQIETGQIVANLQHHVSDFTGEFARSYQVIVEMGNGFIVSSLLWGGAMACLIDGRFKATAYFLLTASAASLFGLIHSPFIDGNLFFPWQELPSHSPFSFAAAYGLLALVCFIFSWRKEKGG